MGNMELSCQMHGSSSNSGEKNMPAERKGCRRSTKGEGKKKHSLLRPTKHMGSPAEQYVP